MAEPLGTTPNPVHRRDASALIGLLAILEGHLHDPDCADRPGQDLARPLLQAGLLEQGHSAQQLRQAINDLNQRLRYAIGEYATPPNSIPVP